ncbi:MAG TPA: AtzE family amidohydrolase [Burkholderiaceae bacterium]|nr:AtzE family amidohydrolase [Burkholderiaceae bacterium]
MAIAAAIARGEVAAAAVVEATLARIARLDPRLGAFTALTADRARGEAGRIDARRARGEALPPLAGVPFAVKNLYDVAGLTTIAGSRVLASQPAAALDAPLVRRMVDAGAVLVGALSMDEFAYGFTTENSHYGTTRNPHDPTRIAGGSSGGCGAAVAAALVPVALGSDTNGSIRVPASFCGIFGLKPTYGRLTRRGTYPFVHSLDHLGPFARNVEDLALAYDLLQGPDELDASCAQRPREPVLPRLRDNAPLRVAVLGGYFDENAGDEARAAVAQAAAALGAREVATVPLAAAGRACAFVITASEGGELHRDHLRHSYAQLEPLSRDRLAAGCAIPAAWYLKAQRVRAAYRAQFLQLFERFDVLVAAATPLAAPPAGAEQVRIGERTLPARPNLGLLTQPISCIGLPVVAAPIVAAATLPLGVQLVGAPWREDAVLQAAWRLQKEGVARADLPPAFA